MGWPFYCPDGRPANLFFGQLTIFCSKWSGRACSLPWVGHFLLEMIDPGHSSHTSWPFSDQFGRLVSTICRESVVFRSKQQSQKTTQRELAFETLRHKRAANQSGFPSDNSLFSSLSRCRPSTHAERLSSVWLPGTKDSSL